MQNTSRYLSTRWLVPLLLGLATTVSGQVSGVANALPPRQAVTEGRTVTLYARYATGHVQWQFAAKGSPAWNAVVDDNTYHGATTTNLEITNVSAALDGYTYRFTDTTGGLITTSNAAQLMVSPLLFPQADGIVLDGSGGLIVSDASTHLIRQVANATFLAQGDSVVCPTTILAGQAGVAGSDDGVGGMASFNQPGGIATTPGLPAYPFSQSGIGNSAGTVPRLESNPVTIADTANGTIRQLKGTVVTTLAGSSSARGNADGAGVAASFAAPIGIAQALDGSFYVADSGNHTIRKITPNGVVTTFAGSPGNAGSTDGVGSAARFNNPTGIAVDASGTVYVSDTTSNLIRKITPAGLVTTLAGVAGVAGAQDGPGSQALFNGPTGLAVTDNGYVLLIADTGNSTIREIHPDGVVTTYAGVPTVAGLRDGQGYYYFDMLLDHPRALAWSSVGFLFIADTGNAAIRAISQYDGVSMTLPLVDNQSEPSSPPPVASSPVPVTPAPTTGQASGGGGACSEWFLAALAGMGLLRMLCRRAKPAGSR